MTSRGSSGAGRVRHRSRLLQLSAAFIVWGAVAAAAPSDPMPVAIYYDGPGQAAAEGYLDAQQVRNLLGHFRLTSEAIPVARYAAGQLAHYQAAFFVGTAAGTHLPASFLADVLASPRNFCWIGRHIGKLLAAPQSRRLGIRYIDYRDDLEFRQVIYKGVTLPKEDPDLNIVAITDPAAARVMATAVNDEKAVRPYAIRSGRFWYFADIPFSYMEEGGRYLVLCDLLHDILEIEHAPQSSAMVRIEDVSADIDPADLRAVVDVLVSDSVPFQIAVIPIFRNPAKGLELYLSDRPALAEAIRYGVAHGGVPVMHGVTHQHRGVSADDYEFWDETANRPLAGDTRDGFLRKLHTGIQELFRNEIFPLAFETPHYAASETDYAAMRQVFSMFYERTMTTPDIGSIQFFPYPTIDRYGRQVVPENLGYVTAENPDPDALIWRARNLRVVRDATASFYFHPFLDPALLDRVVRALKQQGYEFKSLRDFDCSLNSQAKAAVRTSDGKASLMLDHEFWRLRSYDAAGVLVRQQISDSQLSGPVDVAVHVSHGGWTAVDTIAERPAEHTETWSERLRRAWAGSGANRRLLGPEPLSSGTAWILWDPSAGGPAANNQASYRRVLEASGYRVISLASREFSETPRDKTTILVVPESAGGQLTPVQTRLLLDYISAGGRLVAEGRQPWLASLGFVGAGHGVSVSAAVDTLFPDADLHWRPPVDVERFSAPAGCRELMFDAASRQALALACVHGSGAYLHLASAFDPYTADGTSRYPYFAQYLAEAFRIRHAAISPRMEAYFDPAFRAQADLNRLADFWRRSGIRAVYAAAWHGSRSHPYDYDRLIRACHRNGVAVYAWFVLPAATAEMWNEHPEWRERTAAGGDGRVGWRNALNLQNPACFKAALEWTRNTIEGHEWDGINLAELNFDADFEDYLRPDRFVPMNPEVRAGFAREAGFDPALLFQPKSPYYHKRNAEALARFLRYREDLVTDWHRRVLAVIEPLAAQRGLEVIVTALDSLHSAYVRPALGVNSERLAALMKEFPFTLQVEDPAEHWMQPPDRYRRFSETYLRLVPERRRLMFDINVMPDRAVDKTSLASARATGSELALTAAAAAWASGRVAIYSEFTVASQDWALMGTALAAGARMDPSGSGWRIEAPVPLRLLFSEPRNYYRDGQLWPVASRDGTLVPAGAYRISLQRSWRRFLEGGELLTRLLHVSGDLLEAHAGPTGLIVRYSSPGRAVVLVNEMPLSILVDGREASLKVEPGAGAWAILAPLGEHTLAIQTATRTGVAVNLWSYLSASVITAFGAIATFLMAAIYFHLRWRRFARGGSAR
jgi:uncharacterized protein YdaL